jgi:hypothetical protein
MSVEINPLVNGFFDGLANVARNLRLEWRQASASAFYATNPAAIWPEARMVDAQSESAA